MIFELDSGIKELVCLFYAVLVLLCNKKERKKKRDQQPKEKS